MALIPHNPFSSPGIPGRVRSYGLPSSRFPSLMTHSFLLLIALGGAAGAVLRWQVHLWLGGAALSWPHATLAVNLLGSLLMGVMAAWLVSWPGAPLWLRPLVMIGFLGGFTTFSTFAMESGHMLMRGETLPALLYMLLSATGCVAAFGLGFALLRLAMR